MPYEELMLRKYDLMLWKKTHDFLRKTGLSPSNYRDDVFQEGSLAFITYLRAHHISHETLSEDEMLYACRYIDLYYLKAFQDTDGIGLNRNKRKTYYASGGKGCESIEHIEASIGRSNGKESHIESLRDPAFLQPADMESGNLFTLITVNEWLRNLSAEDRAIALDLSQSHTVQQVMERRNKSRQNIRTRLKWMRKSFSDYVEEYPVA